jgi:hypothetical protein
MPIRRRHRDRLKAGQTRGHPASAAGATPYPQRDRTADMLSHIMQTSPSSQGVRTRDSSSRFDENIGAWGCVAWPRSWPGCRCSQYRPVAAHQLVLTTLVRPPLVPHCQTPHRRPRRPFGRCSIWVIGDWCGPGRAIRRTRSGSTAGDWCCCKPLQPVARRTRRCNASKVGPCSGTSPVLASG